MAIASLTTWATSKFKGGRYLTSAGTSGLAASVNTIIAKINEVITSLGTFDTLSVGTLSGYYTSGHSWMLIDGVNPPLFSKIRLQDQATGAWYEIRVTSGVLAAHSV